MEAEWPTDGWVSTIHQMPTGQYRYSLIRHGRTVTSREFVSESEALDWRRDARDHHLTAISVWLECVADWLLEGDLPFADNNCEDLVQVLEARAEYQAITGLDTDEVNAMISNRASAEEYAIVGRTPSRALLSRYRALARNLEPLHPYLWLEIKESQMSPYWNRERPPVRLD